jgi:RNA polymerase sigma-70 factor, ECF subfamily
MSLGPPPVITLVLTEEMPADLLDAAKRRDRDAFQQLVEPYRPELRLHCYRMLGSLDDAEDLVQETFLRAWRAVDRFEGRASARSWLYRIATNASLNALASRASARRVLPEAVRPPAVETPRGEPVTEIPWLEPYPDAALEGVPDAAPGPDARYEMREAVQLAFVAAIQHLSPRQRAVLLLRDVMGWSAAETAQILDASVRSVNSALLRARATIERRFPDGRPGLQSAHDERQRELLDRYLRVWEAADVDGLVALLREDAVVAMPPWPHWYQGRDAIRAFFASIWPPGGPRASHPRLVPTGANAQPAFAMYLPDGRRGTLEAQGIEVLTIRQGAIAAHHQLPGPAGARLVRPAGRPAGGVSGPAAALLSWQFWQAHDSSRPRSGDARPTPRRAGPATRGPFSARTSA